MSKYGHWPFNHPNFSPPKRLLSPPSCLSPTHLSPLVPPLDASCTHVKAPQVGVFCQMFTGSFTQDLHFKAFPP